MTDRKRDAGRQMTSFRLTTYCRDWLAQRAEERGISQAAVIEQLVRDEARREARRKPATGPLPATEEEE